MTKKTPEYAAWAQMKGKCYNPNHNGYDKHGARGCKVCDRWKRSFQNFLDDVGDRPSKSHVFRLFPDPSGDFEPGNASWVISSEIGGVNFIGKWTESEREEATELRRQGLLYREIAEATGRSVVSVERLMIDLINAGVDLSRRMQAEGPLADKYPSRTPDEAKENGHGRYFDGIPCQQGHISPRETNSRKCCVCARELGRRHYKKNKKKITKQIRDRRAQDPETYREKQRAYVRKNRDRVRIRRKAHNSKRRERVAKSGGMFTEHDLDRIMRMQRNRCAYCRRKLVNGDWEADHINPIARGGTNAASNIQILCPSCNRHKHARDPIDFAQDMGYLL